MNNYSYINSVLKINLLFQISKEEKKRTREMISVENIEENRNGGEENSSGDNNSDSSNNNNSSSSISNNSNNNNDSINDKQDNSKDQKMNDFNINSTYIPFFSSIKPKLIFNTISSKYDSNIYKDIDSVDDQVVQDENELIEKITKNNSGGSCFGFDFIDENDIDLLPESEKLLKKLKENQNQHLPSPQHQQQISNYIPQFSMLYLPQELIFHIFQFLDVYSLVQISSTNSTLQLIGNDNELWKRMSLAKFGCSPIVPKPYYPLWKPYFKSFQTYKGVWDTNKKGKIFITNNYKTITHAGDYLGSYQSARGTEPIVSGIVYWEFYINTLSSNQTGFHLVVGVVPESFTIWQTYLTSNGGWGYLADGRKANNSGNGVTYAQSFIQGSTIGVLVDMNQKTLSFYHNGVFQGVAFNNIDGPVYPGVSLLTGGQSVSFVENPKFPKIS